MARAVTPATAVVLLVAILGVLLLTILVALLVTVAEGRTSHLGMAVPTLLVLGGGVRTVRALRKRSSSERLRS